MPVTGSARDHPFHLLFRLIRTDERPNTLPLTPDRGVLTISNPAPIARLIVQLLSLLLGVSALAAGGAAIANSVAGAWRPAWFTFGFELVTLLAAGFGVAAGRGKNAPGVSAAVTIACVAGTVVIASLFGYLAAGRSLFGIGLLPLLMLRTAIAGMLAAVAGAMILSGNRRSFSLLARGGVLIVLSGVVAAGIWLGRPRLAAISDELLMGVVVVGFCLVTGLLAAGVHWVVGAFALATQNDLRAAAR